MASTATTEMIVITTISSTSVKPVSPARGAKADLGGRYSSPPAERSKPRAPWFA